MSLTTVLSIQTLQLECLLCVIVALDITQSSAPWCSQFCRNFFFQVSHDWEQLVNTVYVQDFALLPAAVQSPEELGEFGATLYNYLTVMTVPEKILSVLKCVDLKYAKVLLVPSVQGSFPVAGDYTYGVAQLARVMQPRCAKDQEWELEYQV